jgi:cytidine deaminase
MQDEQIKKLIAAATDAVNKHGDGKNHTMGAAVVGASGKIFTAVNFYHFTGGPCAEIVALARAVSEGEKDLTIIVAAGDQGRGILSPCGRCRQVIFDYNPEMQVVVRRDDGHTLRPIIDLLPDIFDWNEHQPAA